MDKDRIDALRAEFLDDDGDRPMSATLVAGILDALDALVVTNETVARLRAADTCDACAGTGKPTSGRSCMCGGSGRMSDAARYLRKELVIHEMVCGQAHSSPATSQGSSGAQPASKPAQ